MLFGGGLCSPSVRNTRHAIGREAWLARRDTTSSKALPISVQSPSGESEGLCGNTVSIWAFSLAATPSGVSSRAVRANCIRKTRSSDGNDFRNSTHAERTRPKKGCIDRDVSMTKTKSACDCCTLYSCVSRGKGCAARCRVVTAKRSSGRTNCQHLYALPQRWPWFSLSMF